MKINAVTGKVVDGNDMTGTCGFISWVRLSQVLRAAGELRENERVNTFRVDQLGITFRFSS